MLDKYSKCPDCGHHISNHTNSAIPLCRFRMLGDTLCECTTTVAAIEAHVASFDDRVCETCGLTGVAEHRPGGLWVHTNMASCLMHMGKKILLLEKELFSRRAAIRDQKERNRGK